MHAEPFLAVVWFFWWCNIIVINKLFIIIKKEEYITFDSPKKTCRLSKGFSLSPMYPEKILLLLIWIKLL